MLVGQSAEAVGFDKEGASGFDGEGGESRFGTCFEGEGADDWHVEAEILVRLGNFDGDGLAASEQRAAFDGFVGAFEGFDGEDGAVADHDGLSDIEAAHFLGDAEAEGDVFLNAAARFGSGEVSFGREEFIEEGGGGEEFDAVFGKGVGDGAEEGFGVAFFQLGEKEEGGEVGAEVEEIFRRELARHDGVAGAGFFGVGDKFAELSDPEPAQVIDQSGKGRVGFILERGGTKPSHTATARGLGELERVASVPGDDEKRFGRAQRAGLSGGERGSARVFGGEWVSFKF